MPDTHPRCPGQAQSLQHSPVFSVMGQKRVLQAWVATGFWWEKQLEDGRPAARQCTSLVWTPPPQLAVHYGSKTLRHPAAGGDGVLAHRPGWLKGIFRETSAQAGASTLLL